MSNNFELADVFRTWRVVAHNPIYTGETEGFGFSNGQATISGLPKSLVCPGGCEDETVGELCRIHDRLRHLNNLRGYYGFRRVENGRTGRRMTERYDGYQVLSEEEYDEQFGGIESELIELGTL